jgi:hypothetical protein
MGDFGMRVGILWWGGLLRGGGLCRGDGGIGGIEDGVELFLGEAFFPRSVGGDMFKLVVSQEFLHQGRRKSSAHQTDAQSGGLELLDVSGLCLAGDDADDRVKDERQENHD